MIMTIPALHHLQNHCMLILKRTFHQLHLKVVWHTYASLKYTIQPTVTSLELLQVVPV